VTKCDSLGPLVIFHTFAKCCILRYYYYVGTGYVFFSSTASHDLRIFTIASIRSPDKEIVSIQLKNFIIKIFNCNYIVDPGKVEMIDVKQYPLFI
jgi:hypothetical protein